MNAEAVEAAWVCLALAACAAAIVLFRRGFNSDGVNLPAFVGLSTFKGAVFCGLCVFTASYFQAHATGDNMAAVALVLTLPVFLALCPIAAAFVFGVTKLLPRTSQTMLPAAVVSIATLRANISIVVTAAVLTTAVLFTG